MTEKQLAKILDTAEARFDLLGAVVIHRIGLLHPGENIVLVAAASAHRAAAFDACHFVMDYLKTQATFWKQEQRRDGGKSWLACEKVTSKQLPIGKRRKTNLLERRPISFPAPPFLSGRSHLKALLFLTTEIRQA